MAMKSALSFVIREASSAASKVERHGRARTTGHSTTGSMCSASRRMRAVPSGQRQHGHAQCAKCDSDQLSTILARLCTGRNVPRAAVPPLQYFPLKLNMQHTGMKSW